MVLLAFMAGSFHVAKSQENFAEITVIVADSNGFRLAWTQVDMYKFGKLMARDSTDSDGWLTFVRLDPGTYTISATKLGYSVYSREFDLILGRNGEFTLVMQKSIPTIQPSKARRPWYKRRKSKP